MKIPVALILLLALCGCISQQVPEPNPTPSFTTRNSELSEQIMVLTEEKAQLEQQLHELNNSLDYYQDELLAYQSELRQTEKEFCEITGVETILLEGEAHLDGPAVKQRIEETGNYPFITRKIIKEGQMLTISVEVSDGKGRALVVTEPLMGTIFQDAANTAVRVAENRTNQSMTESDVIFGVNGSEVMSVDGPSAGALMTTLLISTIEDIELNSSVTMTGTIKKDGSVGSIGGIVEKAKAAKEAGKTLLLLPESNKELIQWEEVRKTYGLISYVVQEPKKVDAKAYIEKEVGISVEYVENIDDALKYFTQE